MSQTVTATEILQKNEDALKEAGKVSVLLKEALETLIEQVWRILKVKGEKI